MSEDSDERLKSIVTLVTSDSTNVTTCPESKNLESIRWYLSDLSARAIDNQFANAEEFSKATKIAENALTELIKTLNKRELS